MKMENMQKRTEEFEKAIEKR